MTENYYISIIEDKTKLLKSNRIKRNAVTILKVIAFAFIVWSIYLFATHRVDLAIWVVSISFILFVALTILDSKIVETIKLLEERINIAKVERDYLQGDYTKLKTGSEYCDSTHQYSTDLDIFGDESLFQSINRTVTPGGEKKMAEWLKNTNSSKQQIVERQQAVKELNEYNIWCHEFRAVGTLYATKELDEAKILEWGSEKGISDRRWAMIMLYGTNVLSILCWIAAISTLIPYSVPRILFLLQLIVSIILIKQITKQHSKLNNIIRGLKNYFYLIRLIDSVSFKSVRLVYLKNKLLGESNSLKAFKELNKILGAFDGRNNVLVTLFLDGLYMRDLHQIIMLERWRKRYSKDICVWCDIVSEVDVLISMSNFSFNNSEFITPTLSENVLLKATDAGHPLLRVKGKVYNDFDINTLHTLYIVTGANMAGKSTFLRTIGVNLILALSGNVVCAKGFEFSPISLFTSMRTTDNLAKGTSYFHAELLRLKQLVTMAESGMPMFIILDEMLKGTNSVDKLNGSLRFLVKLLEYRICGLVATHDLDLGNLHCEYPNNFKNVCFEIEHNGDDIIYDYKLKAGVSQNMNASILLEQMRLI